MSESQLIAGRYEKGVEIGVGGMGAVYLGRTAATGETVAIKELKPDIVKEDPEIVVRFAHEGEALRKLNHPSIVKVLATAEEEGRHYIVMEYVDGGSLQDRLEEVGQLSIDEILNIGLDISDALARAHRLNIIHRDIKPANVLIASDGTPRLTDFGVARIGDTTRLTKTGVVVGTLAYLSPEAVNGERIDERSDLWAFGVMLYEMLAGVRPFGGETPGAMLMQIMRDPVPDILQYRAYDEIGSWGLPGLIYWLLEKERAKRPQSARLVGAVLENLLTGAELPMNWFGDSSGLYDNNPISLPPDRTSKALRDYTSTSLRLEELVRKNDELTGADTNSAIPQPLGGEKSTILDSRPAVAARQQGPTSTMRIVAAGLLVVGIVLLLSNVFGTVAPTTPDAAAIVVEPVAPGEFMVLVAEPEHIEGETRDVQRFIVDDLRVNLEDAPLSQFRIRTYPGIIRSADEARQVAEQYDAHVILWGNYDSDRVEIHTQLGDFDLFSGLVFPREAVEKIANATYHMRNERQETLAFGVIAIINMLQTARNDPWTVALNLAIAELIEEPTGEVQGNLVNALWHRNLANYVNNTPQGVEYLNEAIDKDPHALLYIARALGYTRLGQLEEARQDTLTAAQIAANDAWVMPQFMQANDLVYFQNDYEGALELANDIVAQVQDNWFPWSYRATLHYSLGHFEEAAADIEHALALNPQANYPYFAAIGLAINAGDFARARALFDEVLLKFPNPTFIERIMLVTYNEQAAQSPLIASISAYGNLTLRRWQAVVDDTEAMLAGPVLAQINAYFLRGFAYCNLGDDAAAEAAYSAGLELDPQSTLLYFMRAEVRRNSGNLLGAGADLATVAASDQAAAYAPLVQVGARDNLSCRTFLDYEFEAGSGAEATQEADE